MEITILDNESNVVEIIPACIPEADAIKAAEQLVRQAAMEGKTLTAADEDGENALSPGFQMLIDFIPHGRRIAASLMDRMAANPAELHLLLSGSPQMADIINDAIVTYFETQIAIGEEAMQLEGEKRQKFYNLMWDMVAPQAA